MAEHVHTVFQQHLPTGMLGSKVASFIYFKGYMPDHSVQRMVPDGHSYLVFELDGMPRYEMDNDTLEKKQLRIKAWLAGMHTKYITISALQNSEMFVIQFGPHGVFPFTAQPASALVNSIISPDSHFADVFDFRASLLEGEDPQVKFRLAEEWLQSKFSSKHDTPPAIMSVVRTMGETRSLELNSIEQLISDTGISKKHFTALFKKHVGLTPKQYQRVVRFNEIMRAIQEKQPIEWAQIALGCGYYDQAHFINEFKKFCGINPSQFIANYQDYDETNFFPLD